MQVKYRIPVDHPGHAPAGLRFVLDGLAYAFKVEAEKVVELEVTVPNFPVEAQPRMIPPSADDPMPTLSIPADPVWPSVERRLMLVEGAVAMLGLKRLDFERRTTEWLPETEEERDEADVFSFKMENGRGHEPTPVAFDMFARALIVADDLAFLEVALNFNRRGREDLAALRYIEAIYNFYFVLETLFAGGLFKKNQVLEKFLNNDELVGAALSARKSLISDVRFWQQQPVDKLGFFKNASAKQLIERVVQVRGVLHHHSGKSAKTWHPSRQSDHAGDAVFLGYVCFVILSQRVFKRMYAKDSVDAYAGIDFRDEHGRRVNFVDMEIPPT